MEKEIKDLKNRIEKLEEDNKKLILENKWNVSFTKTFVIILLSIIIVFVLEKTECINIFDEFQYSFYGNIIALFCGFLAFYILLRIFRKLWFLWQNSNR